MSYKPRLKYTLTPLEAWEIFQEHKEYILRRLEDSNKPKVYSKSFVPEVNKTETKVSTTSEPKKKIKKKRSYQRFIQVLPYHRPFRTDFTTHAIYVLVDSSKCVRYVGQTKSPENRLNDHMYHSHNNELRKWLKSERKSVTMEIIEWVEAQHANYREAHWISEYRKRGHIYNICAGTPESKKKMLDKRRDTGERLKAKIING